MKKTLVSATDFRCVFLNFNFLEESQFTFTSFLDFQGKSSRGKKKSFKGKIFPVKNLRNSFSKTQQKPSPNLSTIVSLWQARDMALFRLKRWLLHMWRPDRFFRTLSVVGPPAYLASSLPKKSGKSLITSSYPKSWRQWKCFMAALTCILRPVRTCQIFCMICIPMRALNTYLPCIVLWMFSRVLYR